MEQDSKYMELALELARSARGQTIPNPMVGAVIVKDGTIVGMGAHLRAGEPHAEVHALRMAGEKAKGATVYVTLEPCSHYGKTPPCAEALIVADVRRVVVATLDPNPLVAGRGMEMLRAAGLEVAVGVREEEAKALNEVFFHYIQTRRPFVTVKTASTLDGKIASFSGHSRWITGAEARAEVHELRRQHDAILVGVGTILADDPLLTARQEEQCFGSQPVRVILDSHLRTPLDARVVQNADTKTWIFTTDAAPREKQKLLAARGVKVITTEAPIRVEKVLDTLGELGITALLVEGGQEVNGSFLQARAIQKVVSHIALKLIGGSGAPSPFGGQGFATMGEAVQLTNVTVTPIGKGDVQIIGYPQWEDQT